MKAYIITNDPDCNQTRREVFASDLADVRRCLRAHFRRDQYGDLFVVETEVSTSRASILALLNGSADPMEVCEPPKGREPAKYIVTPRGALRRVEHFDHETQPDINNAQYRASYDAACGY